MNLPNPGYVNVADVELEALSFLGAIHKRSSLPPSSSCSQRHSRDVSRTARQNWQVIVESNDILLSSTADSRCITLSGHTRPIIDVQFSRSERLLVSLSDDGVAFLWTLDRFALTHKALIRLQNSVVVRLANDYLLAAAGKKLEIYTGLSSFPVRLHRLCVRKRPVIDISWVSLGLLATLNCFNEVTTYRLHEGRLMPVYKLEHSKLILSVHPALHIQEDDRQAVVALIDSS